MAEDIKNLIEKIQKEGVKVAEDKAREIEEKARLQVSQIMEKAKKQAEGIICDAQDTVAKMEESAKVSLKQSGRDLLIAVKTEVNNILNKLITSSVRQSLDAQELSKIITTLVKEHKGKDKEGIIVSLNKADLEKLEKGFLGELKEEIKKGLTLKPSEDISGGFIISYDSGKSHFDFTDKALADYIGSYIKPKIGEILNPAVSEE
jgi:vacuolar-type H+-ATPase subunit E/Vma4